MIKQGLDYDPDGNYVRAWVPEISKIPGGKNSLYLKVRIVYIFDLTKHLFKIHPSKYIIYVNLYLQSFYTSIKIYSITYLIKNLPKHLFII